SVPELRGVEYGVQHGGRVARALLPAVTDRGWHVVAAADAQVVAGVAADDVTAGQTRIEPEFVTEHCLIFADLLTADLGDLVGNRFEHRVGALTQLISVRCAGH